MNIFQVKHGAHSDFKPVIENSTSKVIDDNQPSIDVTSINVTSINEQMVAFIEVTITSLMKSPLIEVIVTSPINEQMVGANVDLPLVVQMDRCYLRRWKRQSI